MAYEHQGDLHVLNHLRGRNFSLHALIVNVSGDSDLVLDSGSPSNIFFDGSVSGQIATLPDATDSCLVISHVYNFFNDCTHSVVIRDYEHNFLNEIAPGGTAAFNLKDKSTPAGEWFMMGRISLSQVLVDNTHIIGVSGFDGQTFLENYLRITGLPVFDESPSGAVDCDNLMYNLAYEAIPGTIRPTLDGRLLTPGLDFVEGMNNQSFTIVLNPSDSNRLNSPPCCTEDLLVSYLKRVIF